MSEKFDVNKFAAELVISNIKGFFDVGCGFIRSAKDKIITKLIPSYEKYLQEAFYRYSKSQTFFIRDNPTYLYDFYVPVGIKSPARVINDANIEQITKINPFSVIIGTAGSGKSTLMRHLFIDSINQKQKVPVFIELRDINDFDGDIIDLVKNSLISKTSTFSRDYILEAMKCGHFIFFLDGYDEVDSKKRQTIIKEIKNLVKTYSDNYFIISSRPDQEFAGLVGFTTFRIQALNREKACLLVEKLPFDKQIKEKFTRDLKIELFDKHESFLSNPLLLTIMLLTYGQSADIPSKLNVFYNQAYEALFQCHDALKGGYQRDRYTHLDIQDFAKVFSVFSILTYDQREFQFPETKALTYIEKAKKITNVNFNQDEYLKDCLKSVCLLVHDGLFITYSHRSFQEYFAAKFICEADSSIQKQLLERYVANMGLDYVIYLVLEMRPKIVEDYVLLPILSNLETEIGFKKRVNVNQFLQYLQYSYSRFEIANGMFYAVGKTKVHELNSTIMMALDKYGHLIGWSGFPEFQNGSNFFIEKYSEQNKIIKFETAKMTVKDDFFVELFGSDLFYSPKTLEEAFKVRKAIVLEQKKQYDSIESMLKL